MEEIIKQYNNFRDINQKIKNISSLYYIHDSGYILMESLVPFIEKVAIIKPDVQIDQFYNKIILPNQTFAFTSNALKSKLEAELIDKNVYMQADVKKGSKLDTDKATLTIHHLELDVRNVELIMSKLIGDTGIPFYNNLSLIYDGIRDSGFIEFSEIEFNDILNSKVSYISDSYFTITKHIFMSIKKNDSLSYRVLNHRDMDNDKKRYVLFKKETDIMDIYTLAAFMVF